MRRQVDMPDVGSHVDYGARESSKQGRGSQREMITKQNKNTYNTTSRRHGPMHTMITTFCVTRKGWQTDKDMAPHIKPSRLVRNILRLSVPEGVPYRCRIPVPYRCAIPLPEYGTSVANSHMSIFISMCPSEVQISKVQAHLPGSNVEHWLIAHAGLAACK